MATTWSIWLRPIHSVRNANTGPTEHKGAVGIRPNQYFTKKALELFHHNVELKPIAKL